MATVYLARDLRHHRNVALKVLSPELGAVLGPERFLSEIRVTANLQHPNLLALFDSGETSGLLYYVMPFVEGETLRHRLDREKQLPVEEAVRLAVAVASALEYAHQHGVIHRDLKPENILLQAGQPVIADFGIALAVSNAGGQRVTQTGLSLGTPQYMSPEQAAGDRAIDGRTDVYSLGAMLYEMLAGEPPHSGTTAQAIIAKLMTTQPQPLRSLRASVPPHVADAVEKALAKLPADRFSTASEFSAALTNPAFTIAHEPQERQSAALARARWIAVASSVLAVVLLTVALWGWLRPPAQKQVVRYQLALDTAEALSPSAYQRAAISADGTKLLYIGGPSGRLMLRPRSQLHGAPLPGTDQAQNPFFSPDGQHVGFMTTDRKLRITSIDGGQPIAIADSLVGFGGLAWARDGFIYAAGAGPSGLVRVSPTAGAVPTRFTTLNAAASEVKHFWPEPLPSGKGVLFTISSRQKGASSTTSSVAVAEIVTGVHRVLIQNATNARYAASGHLLYVTPSGSLMAVPFDQNAMRVTGNAIVLDNGVRVTRLGAADISISSTGTLIYTKSATRGSRELVWVTRDGTPHAVDSTWHEAFEDLALSPDGSSLAIGIAAGSASNLWVKSFARGTNSRLTFDEPDVSYPAWTPDSRSVTYLDGNVGNAVIATKPANGTTAPHVDFHDATGSIRAAQLAPDGKWLIIETAEGKSATYDIVAIRPGLDSRPIPVVATKATERSAAPSPDGRWLAFQSDESGEANVYVVPFPNAGSAKWAVSSRGGSEPVWSHSGKEIFFRDGSGNMVAASVSTIPTFSVGKTTTLFAASPYVASIRHQAYGVSPDDKRFLMMRALGAAAREEIIVVENWAEELKTRR